MSHNLETVFCVVGNGPQGCDLESVTERSRQQWLAILTKKSEPLLDSLLAGPDALDRAGTRIWSTIEACTKALGAPSAQLRLSIDQQNGDAVVFRCVDGQDSVGVLTFPVTLTRGPERIVALAVEMPAVQQVSAPMPLADNHPDKITYAQDILKVSIEYDEEKRPVVVARFPVTSREASNPS